LRVLHSRTCVLEKISAFALFAITSMKDKIRENYLKDENDVKKGKILGGYGVNYRLATNKANSNCLP